MSRRNKRAARFGPAVDWAAMSYYAGPFNSPAGQARFRVQHARGRRNIAAAIRRSTYTLESLSISVSQINLVLHRLTESLRAERKAS